MKAARPSMCTQVSRQSRAGRRTSAKAKRHGTLWTLAAVATLSLLLAPVADARVNPLVIIERQIHKANMLIVLDTSGSMTGVPGGTFSSLSEAGVDCNNGVDCKESGIVATCKSSGLSCMSDADCRVSRCSLTPTVTCSAESPCPTVNAKCSVTGEECSGTCPSLPSTCSATLGTCDSTHPCPVYKKCHYGGADCTTTDCPAVKYCAKDITKVCESDLNCPQESSGGNCAAGGTPPSGCSTQDDCPIKTKCEGTDETCQGDLSCPGPTKGRCSITGDTCNNNNQCKEPGETCVYWTNSCVGPPNPCTLPHSHCNSITANKNDCEVQTNTCTAHPNTCVSPGTNTCVAPLDTADTCVEASRGAPGPVRMCNQAQTVCRNNSDCPSGDSCGPASSRMVIAKRALNSLVSKNYDLVNFGFMSFYQNGYFPYYPPQVGASVESYTVFEDHDKLVANGCFSLAWGPTANCTIAGTQLKLKQLQNSLYLIPTGATTSATAEQNYCGLFCDIKGNVGTGLYQGSYYTFDGTSGVNQGAAVVSSTYLGKTTEITGKTYTYYQALTNYYSGGTPPPFTFTNCEITNTCGAQCGGRWDAKLAPFLDTTDVLATSQSNALALAKALEPASYGGLMSFWSTPTGCTLENTGAPTINASAYHYMQAVKNGDIANGIPADHVSCRANYVLLVTDGAANGPGDVDSNKDSVCVTPACAEADPVAAGCACKSVLAAWNLRQNLGVKTFVVGFAGDTASGTTAYTINENIARAGGTDNGDDGVAPFAYQANDEAGLSLALELAVLSAVKGSYSTAPTSSSAGTQQTTTVAEGRYALDSRMDFPEWRGHLFTYDLASNTVPCVNDSTKMCPMIAWDAYTVLANTDWKTRRIYTWDGTSMVKFQVANDGTITNKAALAALGLGSTPDEAERAARWAMGDPTFKNRAILGAIVNSTPIDIAGPGDIPMPGGHEFFLRYMNRPHLVYVGSSDGMLHAFFLEATTIGGVTYRAGSEAFAFVPPDMMSVIRNQYVQGGQRPSPYDHIFGIADSPKAKSLCVQGCTDAATAVWKTLLLVPEGYGGDELFMLDVTNPFGTNGLADPPINVQWHTDFGTSKDEYTAALGQTISLPAFLLNKTSSLDDFRLIFTSGYPLTTGSTTQGRALITARARDGVIVTNRPLAPAAACTQEYTNLTDVATARDFAKDQDNKMIAGYFGDTAGREWRYSLGEEPGTALDFGCNHPLHFSATVVQLDRDSTSTSHAHEIYPVQVTNSNLDFDTTNLPASKMVIWKEKVDTDKTTGAISRVYVDTAWGNGGKIELTVGNNSEICGVTEVSSSGTVTCKEGMPISARPTATPIGILKKDASGFQVFTMWYAAAPDGCTKGQTYFTIHDVSLGATSMVQQKMGAMVAAEPVTSPVIMRGQVMIFGAGGAYNITSLAPDSIVAGVAIPPSSGSSPFSRFNWTEVL